MVETNIDLVQKKLQDTIAWMDIVLAHLNESVVVVDSQQQTIRFCNQIFAKLMKRERIYLLGLKIANALPLTSAGQVVSEQEYPWTRALKTQRSSNGQYELTTLGGKIWIEIVVEPILSIHQLVIIIRDQSEKRKLESMVMQSGKMAAVGQLAAGLAHELNNPLGVILGFAESMKSRINPEDIFSMPLDYILKETTRCKGLVHNLLMFSRAAIVDQLEEVDVNDAVEKAIFLTASQAKMKDIELTKELAAELPRVSASSNQMEQIMINLINNAMDAVSNGGKIWIRTMQILLNDCESVLLEIEDNGGGIPKETMNRIFEPFFTTKEVGKGTGLGLSLVYEIVQRFHGKIDVKSEVDKGTTFTISFPTIKS